jgi:hypothetical protein
MRNDDRMGPAGGRVLRSPTDAGLMQFGKGEAHRAGIGVLGSVGPCCVVSQFEGEAHRAENWGLGECWPVLRGFAV